MCLVRRQLGFTVSKQLTAKCVSLSLCRGVFDADAVLGPSEKNDNGGGFSLSELDSLQDLESNELPWLRSNNAYSPETNARPSLMWLLQGLSGSF